MDLQNKVLARFLKPYTPNIAGDICWLDKDKFDLLLNNSIVEHYDDRHYSQNRFIESLKGQNIKGERYVKGKIDVVIPTKTETPKILAKADAIRGARGVNSVTLIARKFSQKVGGFAKACNDGAQINKGLGEFILFLNDDVKIQSSDFFTDLIAPFERDKVAMTGAKASQMPWGINGSIMCIRREIFERLGGFDEDFFFMWEDRDLCQNIKSRGYEIEISRAQAEHKGGDSINTAKNIWQDNWQKGVDLYQAKWETNKKRLIGAMIAGTGAEFMVKETIEDLFDRNLIDELIILIDNAKDNTLDICQRLAERYPIKVYYNDFDLFKTAENLLRDRAFDLAISRNPYSLITLDTDELFDSALTRDEIYKMIQQNQTSMGFDFKLAHFWDDRNHVRVDGKWQHQKNIRVFVYRPDLSNRVYDRPLHCGSAPVYAYQNRKTTDFLLLHFGYLEKQTRDNKIKRYEELDPNGQYESKQDWYDTIGAQPKIVEFNRSEFLKNWDL